MVYLLSPLFITFRCKITKVKLIQGSVAHSIRCVVPCFCIALLSDCRKLDAFFASLGYRVALIFRF